MSTKFDKTKQKIKIGKKQRTVSICILEKIGEMNEKYVNLGKGRDLR